MWKNCYFTYQAACKKKERCDPVQGQYYNALNCIEKDRTQANYSEEKTSGTAESTITDQRGVMAWTISCD